MHFVTKRFRKLSSSHFSFRFMLDRGIPARLRMQENVNAMMIVHVYPEV